MIFSAVGGVFALRARWAATAEGIWPSVWGRHQRDGAVYALCALLPLHDIGREQVVVRERVAKLVARQRRDPQNALLHFAIGRVYWVLRDLDEAEANLQAAWAGGYGSPDVHFSAGTGAGREVSPWCRAATPAQRPAGSEPRRGRPGDSLSAARAASPGAGAASHRRSDLHPGLIAYYRKELAQALALAKQAQVLTPWLPEPLRLEGDINHAQTVAELQTQRLPRRASPKQAAGLITAAVAIAGSDGSFISEARLAALAPAGCPGGARLSTTARATR